MTDLDRGRFAALNLLVAQALSAMAKQDVAPADWLDSIEAGCRRATVKVQHPLGMPTVTAMRDQVAETIVLAKQLLAPRSPEHPFEGVVIPFPEPRS